MKYSGKPIEAVAFDADDTLWHNETRFRKAEEFFKRLMGEHADAAEIDAVLYQYELKNIKSSGYGAKTFTLAMVEAALALSERQVTAPEIAEIIEIGNEIINEPLVVFDEVEPVLADLSETFPLMLITKGDLMEQENKIRRSGLGRYFKYTEIVSEKSDLRYRQLLEKYDLSSEGFVMVGNSLRSDILPVRAMGSQAVYVPYHTTWVHEEVSQEEAAQTHYDEIKDLTELPALLRSRVEGGSVTLG